MWATSAPLTCIPLGLRDSHRDRTSPRASPFDPSQRLLGPKPVVLLALVRLLRARELMSIAASSIHAPWHIMRFDHKRRPSGQAAKAFHEGTLQRQFTRMTFLAERYRAHQAAHGRGLIALIYFNRTVTPPTAADTSAPTLGPLSCRITPLAFCN